MSPRSTAVVRVGGGVHLIHHCGTHTSTNSGRPVMGLISFSPILCTFFRLEVTDDGCLLAACKSLPAVSNSVLMSVDLFDGTN